jgi:adenosylhomocysteine nucleosidase
MASRPDRRVAVLAPMRAELRPLLAPLRLRPASSGESGLLTGAIGRIEVVAAMTGIGLRAATRAAERVLDSGRVEHLVVVGVAGGIGPTVAIGDLIVPEVVIDLATCAEHRPVRLGDTPPRGVLASSDALLTDPAEAAGLERRGIVAIDMETAAIAAVCERRGCPWSVFRGISDRADDGSTDPAILGLVGPDGSPDLRAVVRFLLTQPWRAPQLLRLARGLRAGTTAAAGAAVRALQAM